MLEPAEVGVSFLGTGAGIILSLGVSLSMVVVLAICGCCKCCPSKIKMPPEDVYEATAKNEPEVIPSGSKGTSEVKINMGTLSNQGPKNPGDPMSSKPLLSSSYNRALPSLPSTKPPTTAAYPPAFSDEYKGIQRTGPNKGSLTRESSASDLYATVDKFTGSKNKHVYAKIRDRANLGDVAGAAFGSGGGYSAIDDDEESESGDALYSKINSAKPRHSTSTTIRLAPVPAPNNERVYEYPTFQGDISKLPRQKAQETEAIYGGSSEDPYSSIKSDSESGGLKRKDLNKAEEPLYEGVGPPSAVSDEIGAGNDPRYAMIHRSALDSGSAAKRQSPMSWRRTSNIDGPEESNGIAMDDDIDQLYAKIKRRHSTTEDASTSALTTGARDLSRASAGPGYPMIPEKRFELSRYTNEPGLNQASSSHQSTTHNDHEYLQTTDGTYSQPDCNLRGDASTASGEPPYKYITVREPLEALRARIENSHDGSGDVSHSRLPSENSAHYYSSISENSYETVQGTPGEEHYERRGPPPPSDLASSKSGETEGRTRTQASTSSIGHDNGSSYASNQPGSTLASSNISTVRISFGGEKSSSSQLGSSSRQQRPDHFHASENQRFESSQTIPEPPTSPVPPPLSRETGHRTRNGSHEEHRMHDSKLGTSIAVDSKNKSDSAMGLPYRGASDITNQALDQGLRRYDFDASANVEDRAKNSNQSLSKPQPYFADSPRPGSTSVPVDREITSVGDAQNVPHPFSSTISPERGELSLTHSDSSATNADRYRTDETEKMMKDRHPFRRQDSFQENAQYRGSSDMMISRGPSTEHNFMPVNTFPSDSRAASDTSSARAALANTSGSGAVASSNDGKSAGNLQSQSETEKLGRNEPNFTTEGFPASNGRPAMTGEQAGFASTRDFVLSNSRETNQMSDSRISSDKASANTFSSHDSNDHARNRESFSPPTRGSKFATVPPEGNNPAAPRFGGQTIDTTKGNIHDTSIPPDVNQLAYGSDSITQQFDSTMTGSAHSGSSQSSPSKIPRFQTDTRATEPLRSGPSSFDAAADRSRSQIRHQPKGLVSTDEGIAKLTVNASSDQLISPSSPYCSETPYASSQENNNSGRPLEISIPNRKEPASSRISTSRSRSHSRDKLRIAKTSTLPKSSPKSPSKEEPGRWGVYRGPPIVPVSPQPQPIHSPRGVSSPGTRRRERGGEQEAKPRSASATSTTPFDKPLDAEKTIKSNTKTTSPLSTASSSVGSSPEKKSTKSNGSSSKSPSKDGASIRSPAKEPSPPSTQDFHFSTDKGGGKGDGHTHHVNCFCHSRRPDPVAIVKENISTIEKSGSRSGGGEERVVGGTNRRNRNSSSIFRL